MEAAPPARRRSIALRVAVGVVTMAAIVFLALALREGLNDTDGAILPSAGWIVASAAVGVPSVIAAAHGWAVLLPSGIDRGRFLRIFYTTQLWRHLPIGGAAQVAGQITLSRSSGVPIARAALASPIAIVMSLIAAGCIGALPVVTAPSEVRFAPLLVVGIGSLLLLRRGLLVRFLSLARRWIPRVPSEEHIPSQSALFSSCAWAAFGLLAHGTMLAVLLHPSGTVSPLAVVSANAAAWGVGVVALPAPAGLGVREAVLLALLGGSAPTSTLLGAALIQRLVLLLVELLTMVSVTGVARLRLDAAR